MRLWTYHARLRCELCEFFSSLLGATLYQAGKYDEALEQFREIPDGDANTERRHRLLASIYERKGMQREAIAESLKGLRLDGKSELAASIEHDYLSSGYESARRHLLSEDLRQAEQRAKHADPSAPSVEIAADYALLGDNDKALQVLDQAVQQHNDGLLYLKTDDRFVALHADPRFQNLVRRMGLPL